MFFLSASSNNHVVIHAGSIGLAIISQVIVDIFVVLAEVGSAPNGE